MGNNFKRVNSSHFLKSCFIAGIYILPKKKKAQGWCKAWVRYEIRVLLGVQRGHFFKAERLIVCFPNWETGVNVKSTTSK